MGYVIANSKAESIEQLNMLISAFEKDYGTYKSQQYSEAQLRIDFINPLLKTFGWDVDNELTKSQFLRDVIQEESIDVKEEDLVAKKNPDYTLRIQGIRKFFIEAKKVAIDLDKNSKPAFQTRRYGWNANLGVSVVTNFESIIVYDCRHKPNTTDDVGVARYQTFHYTEFISKFEDLYQLLSFQSVGSGYIDEYFSVTHPEATTFDEYFLRQIENWRTLLANNVIQNNKEINEEDINLLIQRLLNRIVFLRICEDREIEKYETLKNIKSYEELKSFFIQSDKKYNSGLFDFIEDNISLSIILQSEILIEIFNELYYPESPYDFSVVDPAILSQIYERYLGSKIAIVDSKEITIVEEPEVLASSGVVPTPKLIVANIVKETLTPLFKDKSLKEIESIRIADICCGSGTFLISIYDFILEKSILFAIDEGVTDDSFIYKSFDGSYHLTLKAKQSLLVNNIFGVDINPYAVEVSKFSLLLKLLEGENSASINNHLNKYHEKILPSLEDNIKSGNSLVDNIFFEFNPDAINNDELLYKVKPFNWKEEFPFLNKTLGFDAIIGNPPYVRIQNMVKYLPEEIKYYQNNISGYTVAESDTFDKYYLFIQRAISLIHSKGTIGYIVPNKFFIVKGGKALREFISSNCSIRKIIHFGVTQIFPNRSTYTAIVILDRQPRTQFEFKRIKNVITEFIPGEINYEKYENKVYKVDPWIFVSKESEDIFRKLHSNSIPLIDIAEIPVGLQTSADKIYIIEPVRETENSYVFKKGASEYEVEKAICKPCLYDLSFSLFDSVKSNAQIIFPYLIEDGKANTFSEEYFQRNFPLSWAYLNLFKEPLSKRSINGSKEPMWYQFGRSQSLTKFHDSPKLIWPVLSTKPSYIYDENNIQFTGGGNGPYYALTSHNDYSLLFILGIISHPLFEAMVKAGASEFRGAYYSHGKQFIENLPIKPIDFTNSNQKEQHDNIVKTVKEIIATKEKYNTTYIGSKRNIFQRKINYLNDNLIEQVNKLYSISNEEMNIVLNDEMFLNDLNED